MTTPPRMDELRDELAVKSAEYDYPDDDEETRAIHYIGFQRGFGACLKALAETAGEWDAVTAREAARQYSLNKYGFDMAMRSQAEDEYFEGMKAQFDQLKARVAAAEARAHEIQVLKDKHPVLSADQAHRIAELEAEVQRLTTASADIDEPHNADAHQGKALSQTGYVEGCIRCDWLKGDQRTSLGDVYMKATNRICELEAEVERRKRDTYDVDQSCRKLEAQCARYKSALEFAITRIREIRKINSDMPLDDQWADEALGAIEDKARKAIGQGGGDE